jgi:hypothetical protein
MIKLACTGHLPGRGAAGGVLSVAYGARHLIVYCLQYGEQMGLIASSSAPTANSLSVFAGVGVGVGGILVTGVLLYLLAYLNVVEATEHTRQQLRSLLVAASVPLMFVFGAIIVFESLTVIGLL